MKIDLTFEQAWFDIYELCYDVWELNDKFYLICIELDGYNLTSIMTTENDTLVQTLNKWNSSEYRPQTEEEQSEYLLAYTRLVEYVLDNSTYHLNNHFGPCVMVRNCYIIYTHSIYQFDVDDEEWHRLQDNHLAHPVIFEMWKELCEQQKNK